MNVTLIPFLLAANVVFNDTDNLEHGVRAVYTISRMSALHQQLAAVAVISLAEFECENVEENKLRCISTKDDNSNVEEGMPSWGTFDITFDEDGVSNVTISSTLPTNKIRKLKRLANLFHIGTNLTSLSTSDGFVDGELTTMGMCLTHYNITCGTDEDEDSKEETKQFTLNMSPAENENNCAKVSIEKSRLPISCCAMGNYFFDIDNDFYVTSVKSFEHEMVIVPKAGKFMSSEEAESNGAVTEETRTYRLEIILKDIIPADGPFPEISEPVTIDLKV